MVMASDSQPILLREQSFEVLGERGDRNKIVPARLAGFSGLAGYVGTERLGKTLVRERLRAFLLHNQELSLADFCKALTGALSAEWEERELDTCLWVFVAGYEGDEARFWYVVNGELDPSTGLYHQIGTSFRAVNDLDDNYITRHRAADLRLTKRAILANTTFWFRNGAVVPPTTEIVDAYNALAERLHSGSYRGFVSVRTLDHFAYIARQRMEFIKRLYSSKHGIYAEDDPPIAGKVYVYTVPPDGTVKECPKLKEGTKELR
jgi:hypothetical protein